MKNCDSKMGTKAKLASKGNLIPTKISGNSNKSPKNSSWPKKQK